MGITREQFVDEISSGDRTEYVEDELLEWFGENAEYEVVERSALKASEFSQDSFLSVTVPAENTATDEELVERVQSALATGHRDIQKYQFRHGSDIPTKVQIWRSDYGFKAFALAEE